MQCLLKFGITKRQNQYLIISKFVLKMKYSNIPPSAITGLSTIFVLI